MKKVRPTILFNRDLKRMTKRNKDLDKMRAIIKMLASNIPLLPKHKPHKLTGDSFPKWECHIEPNWLLVYEVQDDVIVLYRTGTHSDIF